MSPRFRPTFWDLLSESIWWAFLSWLVVLLIGAVSLNYHKLDVTGIVPMLRSVSEGSVILLKNYWPWTAAISVLLGWVIARKRNP